MRPNIIWDFGYNMEVKYLPSFKGSSHVKLNTLFGLSFIEEPHASSVYSLQVLINLLNLLQNILWRKNLKNPDDDLGAWFINYMFLK